MDIRWKDIDFEFLLNSALIFGVISLSLFSNVMGIQDFDGNEVNYLPLAKQFVNPDWVPHDWYLNQPPGYRILFQFLFGWLMNSVGFLWGAIIGRTVCYLTLAVGIVLIGKKLRLSGILLILLCLAFIYPRALRRLVENQFSDFDLRAIAAGLLLLFLIVLTVLKTLQNRRKWLPFLLLFLCFTLFVSAQNSHQGIVAKEYIVTGLEPKTVAYGFVMLSIASLLYRRYRLTALLLGIATSFHVLIGGYSFLCVTGTLAWSAERQYKTIRTVSTFCLVYILGSVFAIRPVVAQLFTPSQHENIPYSFIYVFLRHPHHLNPGAWPNNWWITFMAYLLIALLSFAIIRSRQEKSYNEEVTESAQTLLKLTLISTIPFLLGVLVSPFDTQGIFLQYYPFRLCDVLLPFSACLLFFAALNQTFSAQRTHLSLLVCCTLITALSLGDILPRTINDFNSLQQYPVADTELAKMYDWAKAHTPKNTTFITFPNQMNDFTWVTERATIAKLKFAPSEKQNILEWDQRLRDLNGGQAIWPSTFGEDYEVWRDVGQVLDQNYVQLSQEAVVDLMHKYSAAYFVTDQSHSLNLGIAFKNKKYIVYGAQTSQES